METEESINSNSGPWIQGLKWGVILMILSTILFHLIYWNVDFSSVESLGKAMSSPLNYISFAFLIGCILMAQVQHKNNDLGGYMTYGRAIGVAMVCASVAGLLDAFYTFIYYTSFHPEAMVTAAKVSMQKMEESGFFTQEQLEGMYQNSMKGAKPLYHAIGKFANLVFVGLVVSLITSIFTRKKNPEETF